MNRNSTWFRRIDDAELKKLAGGRAQPGAPPVFRFIRPPTPGTTPVFFPPPDCGGQPFLDFPDIVLKALAVDSATMAAGCPPQAELDTIWQLAAMDLNGLNLPSPDVRVRCQGAPASRARKCRSCLARIWRATTL